MARGWSLSAPRRPPGPRPVRGSTTPRRSTGRAATAPGATRPLEWPGGRPRPSGRTADEGRAELVAAPSVRGVTNASNAPEPRPPRSVGDPALAGGGVRGRHVPARRGGTDGTGRWHLLAERDPAAELDLGPSAGRCGLRRWAGRAGAGGAPRRRSPASTASGGSSSALHLRWTSRAEDRSHHRWDGISPAAAQRQPCAIRSRGLHSDRRRGSLSKSTSSRSAASMPAPAQ